MSTPGEHVFPNLDEAFPFPSPPPVPPVFPNIPPEGAPGDVVFPSHYPPGTTPNATPPADAQPSPETGGETVAPPADTTPPAPPPFVGPVEEGYSLPAPRPFDMPYAPPTHDLPQPIPRYPLPGEPYYVLPWPTVEPPGGPVGSDTWYESIQIPRNAPREWYRHEPRGWHLQQVDTRTVPRMPPTQQPPTNPPVPIPRGASGGVDRPGLPSGGWSWDVYEEIARRVVRDTVRRVGTPIGVAGPRILGPIGAVIGVIIDAERLGSGERQMMPTPEIPPVDIPVPTPVFDNSPLPLPSPVPTPLPMPLPAPSAPSSTSSPTPSSTSSPTPSSSPSPAPQPAPRPQRFGVPWSQILSGIILGRATRVGPGTRSYVDPLTQVPFDALPSPVISPTPATPITATPTTPIPTPTPLTPFQPSVASSAPPALRTRTRTRECNCEPKKKRKKARECAARAPLRWAGGPKKGKPAGTRCYAFKG